MEGSCMAAKERLNTTSDREIFLTRTSNSFNDSYTFIQINYINNILKVGSYMQGNHRVRITNIIRSMICTAPKIFV
jgi:hypothetical protein